MYKAFKTRIKKQDEFPFVPSLGFKLKKKFSTIPGGLFSVFFKLFTYWLWFH